MLQVLLQTCMVTFRNALVVWYFTSHPWHLSNVLRPI